MTLKRTAISKQLRKQVTEKYGLHCYLCGKKTTAAERQLDHLTPVAKGGLNTIENLRPSCKKCNRQKGKIDLMQYVQTRIEKVELELATLKRIVQ